MAITLCIDVPTWLTAGASLLAVFVWAREQPARRMLDAERDAAPEKEDDDWHVVADVAEPPTENVAEYYFTAQGQRVHTSRKCSGLRTAKNILEDDTPEIHGKTRCNLCFLTE